MTDFDVYGNTLKLPVLRIPKTLMVFWRATAVLVAAASIWATFVTPPAQSQWNNRYSKLVAFALCCAQPGRKRLLPRRNLRR